MLQGAGAYRQLVRTMKGAPIKTITVFLVAVFVLCPLSTIGLKYTGSTNLNSVDASLIGAYPQGKLGQFSALVGDVNGDGYDDFVVCAPNDAGAGHHNGTAYLILGSPKGWQKGVNVSKANASFIGMNPVDYTNTMVSGVGDVNGDGFSDFLLGSSTNDTMGASSGVAYLFFGRASGWSMNTSVSKANVTFKGEAAGDEAGYSVSGAGDVNGDGIDDLLIGAPANNAGGAKAGKAYLFFGRTAWSSVYGLGSSNASFLGELPGDRAGISVAGAGDVNGDHLDDILIGAPLNNASNSGRGKVYVIFGNTTGWSNGVKLSKFNASYVGTDTSDGAGGMLSSAGDVNGDGLDDILIGDPYAIVNLNTAGKALLVFGHRSGWETNVSLSKANASWLATDSLDCLGRYLTGAGDVNGDGRADIAIGSEAAEGGSTTPTYLILGKTSGWALNQSPPNGVDTTFSGEKMVDRAGAVAYGHGDINGDGYDDLVIGAYQRDDLGSNTGKAYIIFPDNNKQPNPPNKVTAYFDQDHTLESPVAQVGDVIHLVLKGTDADSTRRNIAVVNMTSDMSHIGFRLRLMETGKHTGVFEGNFTIKDRTHGPYDWIGANPGGFVNVSAFGKPSVYYYIQISSSMKILPLKDKLFAKEDANYNQTYWTGNWPSPTWSLTKAPKWLHWDGANRTLNGTPDNSDVGASEVLLKVQSGSSSDTHDFQLTVLNTPPSIETTDTKTAMERVLYSVDYNSTDDGQGTITWHLSTNASNWITLDQSTGVLSGTPPAGTAGSYHFNISVDDGNGGWASHLFNLTITKNNAPPKITSSDNLTAYEDSLYEVKYTAVDINPGDVLTWGLKTNASVWLGINPVTGRLWGTPSNADVGQYWVNVTVSDNWGASDHHNFTLTVINVEDPPVFVSLPVKTATALKNYHYTALATDEDKGDIVTYGLEKAPSGMTINGTSGSIDWLPTIEDAGIVPVVVTASDGKVTVRQAYNITVTKLSVYPPEVTQLTPLNNSQLTVTTPAFSWRVSGTNSPVVYYDLYMDSSSAKVSAEDPSCLLVEKGLVSTIFMPTVPLDPLETYYWMVSPNDGTNLGVDLSGIWNFYVGPDSVVDSAPKAVLNAPVRGSLQTQVPVQLEWSGAESGNNPIMYDVYLHSDRAKVEKHDATARIASGITDEALLATKLLPGKGYFWTVVPYDKDNTGDCLSGTWGFNITLDASTDAAPIIDSSPITKIAIGETYQYQVAAHDPDKGDTLIYSLIKRPIGMVIDHALGLVIWVPRMDQIGTNTVRVRVSDGRVFTDQVFDITVSKKPLPNQLPRINSTAPTEVELGKNYYYKVSASDPDVGDRLNYSLITAPANMTIDKQDGVIQWTPVDSQLGNNLVSVMVSDGKAQIYQNFTVLVKRPAIVTPPPSKQKPVWQQAWFLLLVIIIACAGVGTGAYAYKRSKDNKKRRKEEARKAAEAETKAQTRPMQVAATVAPGPPPQVLPEDHYVEDFDIKEVYIIYNDGRLIGHVSNETTHEHDHDLMSGMLVAIRGFVKESFTAASGLDSFEFGGRKVILVGGNYLILAVVLDGTEPPNLRDEMLLVATKIEGMHTGVIEEWDGEVRKLGAAEEMVRPLMEMKTALKIKAKKRAIIAKSGVEFYSGYVRLRVGIVNETETPINNISLTLTYDERCLKLVSIKPDYPHTGATIYFDPIEPGEKRSVVIYFDPVICQESHIDGYIYYTDAQGVQQYTTMKRRPVDVVCPIFYTQETVNVPMLKRLLSEISYDDRKIYRIEKLAILAAAYQLGVDAVKAHDVKFVREYVTKTPYEAESWFYGEVKETDEKIVIKVAARQDQHLLEFYVATSNLASMTGLLAELGFEFSRRIKDKNLEEFIKSQSSDTMIAQELQKTKLLLDLSDEKKQ